MISSRTYELSFSPRARHTSLRLDLHGARRLLAARIGHAGRMRELRSLLATRSPAGALSAMTDAEVVDHLATRIAARSLHVYVEALRRRDGGFTPDEETEDALGPLSLAKVEEPADERIDAVAQATAMRQAAAEGLPFCEECEKARQAELAVSQAAPLPDPYVGVDVAAQAAAMQQAAVDGVPFCEECEKARQAELAASQRDATPDAYADTDVAAQAAVMRQAATDGAPFCEECERARAAEASAAATEGA